MSADRWDKVGKILEEVQNVPPGERAAFLQERCEDEALRQEVISLLQASEDASGFFGRLESAVPAPPNGPRDIEAAGNSGPDPLGLEDTHLQHYEVEETIGGGGMGVVYRARDPRLHRRVALKFLPSHLSAHEEAEERFFREARAAAALNHPHIARIHEVGETEDGRRFIVMDYYEGDTLKEKLRRGGPLPDEDAVRYAKQIASALTAAHDEGIIHRDVKPGNVIVTEEGGVKLLDFGLAKAASETRLTEPGQRLGTAAYMSPEQVRGDPVDLRADVWALGVLLYEMLTGERPFQGQQTMALLQSILHDEPVPLDERRSGVPSGLTALVERCLRKDPDDRCSSAEAVYDALEAVTENRGDASGSSSEDVTVASSSSMTGWEWGATLAVLVLLVSAGGYWLAGRNGSGSVSPETQLAVSTVPTGATVLMDGRRMGTTPLADTVEGSAARLRVQRAGYRPVDTTVAQLEDKQQAELAVSLTPKATSLSIETNPEARAFLDGEEEGRTPVIRRVRKDTVRVRVEQQGFFPIDTLVPLLQTEKAQLDLQLERRSPDDPEPPEEVSPRYGALTLNASPSGSVFVDGEGHPAGEAIRVTAGDPHQIRVEHPDYGTCDTTLTVETDRTETLTCHFEHQVGVRTGLDEPWANVYVDGANTGQSTPHDTLLTTGRTHDIGARIQRDPATTISGGTHRRHREAGDRDGGPKNFTGRSTTITLRPSFERKTHVIDFRASESKP